MSHPVVAAARRRRFPIIAPILAAVLGLLVSGCGINKIPTYEEQAKAKWSEVENQYQRRSDLIPNLVETVKGYAKQEREVLAAVTEARSRATSIQATPDLVNNPDAFKKFQEAQLQLTGFVVALALFSLPRLRFHLIADEGIHAKVDPATWNGAIDVLIAAIKDGRPADGFVGAVERCGAVLAEHFPGPPGDVKAEDLPDKLVEI